MLAPDLASDTGPPADDALAGFAFVRQARAKVNLSLHVTGQRADGYHLIESLVTFTRFGDRLGLSPAEEDRFTLSGPFGPGLAPDGNLVDNLVTAARDLLREALALRGLDAPPVHLHLEKNLPVASGVGGGSADAAATLSGLAEFWQAPLDPREIAALALRLGADVPMCLSGAPLVARGIGEDVRPLPDLPSLAMVLANPLVAVTTPAVFRALAVKDNPPLCLPASAATANDWLAALSDMRNDLEQPARGLCPEIGEISALLDASGALFVRMSGSGATCFGIYETVQAAQAAARDLEKRRPHWFFIATESVAGRNDDGPH